MEKINKKQRTKNKILSTTIKLFEEFGIENVTMEQIFSTAGIAKGTLYNHFSSKEEIIASYIENTFVKQEKIRLSNFQNYTTTREKLIYIFTELTIRVEKNQELFEKYIIFRMQEMVTFNQEKKSGFSKISNYLIDDGINNGEISNTIPKNFLLDFFDFIFFEIIKQVSFEKGIDKNKLIENYVTIFIKGIS